MAMLRKLLPLILCARRPLTLPELAEAYAIDQTSDHLDVKKIPTDTGRILLAFSNLVVFEKRDSTIRFAHQTVKQYLLAASGHKHSNAVLTLETAQQEVAELCVIYLMLSDFETQIAQINTAATEVKSTLVEGILWNQHPLTRTVVTTISQVFMRQKPITQTANGVQLKTRVIPRSKEPLSASLRTKYSLLEYMVTYWASHAAKLSRKSIFWPKFRKLCFERQMLVEFRPWQYFASNTPIDADVHDEIVTKCIDWSLRNNAVAFFDLVSERFDRPIEHFLDAYATIQIQINTKPMPQDVKRDRQKILEDSSNPIAYACAAGSYEVLEKLTDYLDQIILSKELLSLLAIADAESPLKTRSTFVMYNLRCNETAQNAALRYAFFEANPYAVKRLLTWQTKIRGYPHKSERIFLDWITHVDLPLSSLNLECYTLLQTYCAITSDTAVAALQIIVKRESVELLSKLLELPVFYDSTDTGMSSATIETIMEAAKHKRFDLMDAIINKRIHKLKESLWPDSFLECLLETGFEIAESIIFDIVQDSDEFLYRFRRAATLGNHYTVRKLLQYPIPIPRSKLTEELQYAIHSYRDSVALGILEHLAAFDIPFGDDRSVLHQASSRGCFQTVDWLLKRGADVNFCSKTLVSPLIAAAQNGHADVAGLLVQRGADVGKTEDTYRCKSSFGLDPRYTTQPRYANAFDIAVARGHLGTARVLIENGAKPVPLEFWKNLDWEKLLGISDLMELQNTLKDELKKYNGAAAPHQ